MGGTGLAVALTLLAWLSANDAAAPLAAGDAPAAAKRAWLTGSPTALDPSDAPVSGALAAAVQSAPPMTSQPAPAAPRVPIAMVATEKLYVGEMSDLIVGVGANPGIGEISFTVRFDPDILQVRTGTEGNWTAGAAVDVRFTAEISGTEDRVQIRSTVSGGHLTGAGGSIALVQFQAVAPGSTSVTISDVTLKDAAGSALPFALGSSSVPVTAESLPPPLPHATRPRSAVPVELPASETVDVGD